MTSSTRAFFDYFVHHCCCSR